MLRAEQVEELMCVVSALDREALIRQFQSYQASFPLDFSQDFLRTASLERLRHIFVAVCLQTQHMPEITHAA
jgi:hypothetical protein